jgi:hypothetical protein
MERQMGMDVWRINVSVVKFMQKLSKINDAWYFNDFMCILHTHDLHTQFMHIGFIV